MATLEDDVSRARVRPPHTRPSTTARVAAAQLLLPAARSLVFVVYYIAAWGANFSVFFGAITLGGLDGIQLLTSFGVDAMLREAVSLDISHWSPHLVNAVIAAECCELLEPFRLPFVLATTPALSRWLRGKKGDGGSKSP